MMSFLIPLAVAVLIVAACTVVLVRRDRRRMEASADSLRIEATAHRGLRETRRRARAYQNRFLRGPD
ncbi:hypothetical protein [Streptomyces sp. NBC_00078]|uniref:hypothetical protein n=1 Tax=unclassified Streptomyces TaxID=2593676 RepID=UPI002253F8A1|nr:hypothetical protein [Streptomyces sp. NBC_00078]MCX5424256.1 hypothetical protein [Streptomyces sp. NBC_00078]